MLLDNAPPPDVPEVKSPKSCAFPADAMVTNSTVFTLEGVTPPINNPLVGEQSPTTSCVVAVKSPKSDASPVVAMVINSILLIILDPSLPPPVTALVKFEKPA